jgi:rod shape-determining protein MreD
MTLLIAAVGATVAAILESSVLTQLMVGGVIKPDLVFALTVAVAMVLGFEDGMVWAVVGGLLLDMLLADRALGSTTLALLLTTGIALLVARVTARTRTLVVAATVLALSFAYQPLMLVLLALTSGVGITRVPFDSFAVIGVMNAVIAMAAAWVARGLMLRYGPAERIDW